jgi:hypothetical protein
MDSRIHMSNAICYQEESKEFIFIFNFSRIKFLDINFFRFYSQENKRRTKHVLKTLNPEWNCTVVYPNVHKEELQYKTLEFTLWDWDRFKSNDFLGMVKVELRGKLNL